MEVIVNWSFVEDLEGQLEELRSPKQTTKDSYRIDDSTLRQLFMNYFTATADMKPDIAVLLASILEYPPEDVQKVGVLDRCALQTVLRSSNTLNLGTAPKGSLRILFR